VAKHRAFLNSTIEGGECPGSRPASFTPSKLTGPQNRYEAVAWANIPAPLEN